MGSVSRLRGGAACALVVSVAVALAAACGGKVAPDEELIAKRVIGTGKGTPPSDDAGFVEVPLEPVVVDAGSKIVDAGVVPGCPEVMPKDGTSCKWRAFKKCKYVVDAGEAGTCLWGCACPIDPNSPALWGCGPETDC